MLASKNKLLLAVAKSEKVIAGQGCKKCWWHGVRQGLTSWQAATGLLQFEALQDIDGKLLQEHVQGQVDAQLHRFVGSDLR